MHSKIIILGLILAQLLAIQMTCVNAGPIAYATCIATFAGVCGAASIYPPAGAACWAGAALGCAPLLCAPTP